MTTTVEAVYQGGVFKPLRPVDLPENQRVRLQLEVVHERPPIDFCEWLEGVREFQANFIARHGYLPDSTPLIRDDRMRAT